MRTLLTIATGLLVALGAGATQAGAASHQTLHLWSKTVTYAQLDASGKPIARPPMAGDYFTNTDDDYVGDHAKHGRRSYATDHVECTFTSVDLAHDSLSAVCSAQIALPGGMLIVDRKPVTLGAASVLAITGGTGKYAKVKGGTIAFTQYDPNANDSDVVVRLRS